MTNHGYITKYESAESLKHQHLVTGHVCSITHVNLLVHAYDSMMNSKPVRPHPTSRLQPEEVRNQNIPHDFCV